MDSDYLSLLILLLIYLLIKIKAKKSLERKRVITMDMLMKKKIVMEKIITQPNLYFCSSDLFISEKMTATYVILEIMYSLNKFS